MSRNPAIKRLCALCHEALAAELRADAAAQETLPVGTPVIVYTEWKGAIDAYPCPHDGNVAIKPDDAEKLRGYRIDQRGTVMVPISALELEDRPTKDPGLRKAASA
jgi:hypothetical protein